IAPCGCVAELQRALSYLDRLGKLAVLCVSGSQRTKDHWIAAIGKTISALSEREGSRSVSKRWIGTGGQHPREIAMSRRRSRQQPHRRFELSNRFLEASFSVQRPAERRVRRRIVRIGF